MENQEMLALSGLLEESDALHEKIEHFLLDCQEFCLDEPQESQVKAPVEGAPVESAKEGTEVFDEAADDDEVVRNFFHSIDENGDGIISRGEIEIALEKFKDRSETVQGLHELLNKLSSLPWDADYSLDLESFKAIVRQVPRINGQRVQWVRSLGLDCVLARHLNAGGLFDELSGIKDMTGAEIKRALDFFSKEVYSIVVNEQSKLRSLGTAPEQAMSVMSKFSGGFTGRFGDTQMFQSGLESEIGTPDSMILKGILRENTLDPTSEEQYRPSNYGIVTSDLVEYARVFGNPAEFRADDEAKLKYHEVLPGIPTVLLEVARGMHDGIRGPTEAELRDLKAEFERLKRVHARVTGGSRAPLFPGEIGDVLHSVDCEVRCANAELALAAHRRAQALAAAPNRVGSMYLELGPPPTADAFALTVCSRRPIARDALAERLAAELGAPVSAGAARALVYARHGSREALEKHLRRLGLAELRQRAGLPAAAADECVEAVLAGFRAQTEEWRARGGVRVQGRVGRTLRELLEIPEVRAAGLRVEEAVQAYQYTGPPFQASARRAPRGRRSRAVAPARPGAAPTAAP